MRNIFLMITTIFLFGVIGCGKTSQEAKDLQTHELKLIGIPPEIVVNICQDDNDNGHCDENEFTAKISVNRDDTAKQMWEKVTFDDKGIYILNNYDPTKNIIMEIEDKESLKYDKGFLSLKYNPDTQELSVLQAVIDADFLSEEETKSLKESTNRDKIDKVLLDSLRVNQNLLKDENLSTTNALAINLEEIAKGLIELNVSTELPKQLDECSNDSCIEEIVKNTIKEVELTQKEAEELARSKNFVDAYIGKLNKPVEALCKNGKTYKSNMEVGEKGKINFDDFPVGTECTITIFAGATIDSNNNGKIDETDKLLAFDMIGSAEDTHITPLTSLLIIKRKKGENIDRLQQIIANFDPVVAPSRVATNSGIEKIKIEKLIVLTEVLKSGMKQFADISLLDLSNIVNTKSTDKIENLDIDKLLSKLPNDIKKSLKERAVTTKKLIGTIQSLDSSKIDINSFFVGVSDGEKSIEDALNNSLIVKLPKGMSIFSFVIQHKEGTLTEEEIRIIFSGINQPPLANAGEKQKVKFQDNVTLNGSKSSDKDGTVESYEWRENGKLLGDGVSITLNTLSIGTHAVTLIIKDNKGAIASDSIVITIYDRDTPDVLLGKTLVLGSQSVSIAKNLPFSLNTSSSQSLSSFYNISFKDATANREFNNRILGFKIKVVNKIDTNNFIELRIDKINLSSGSNLNLETTLSTDTSIYIKESISNRSVKTYSTYLLSELVQNGLSIKIGDIINSVKSSEVVNGINRMEDYLQTSNKKYTISIEFTNLESAKLTLEYTTILGDISVN